MNKQHAAEFLGISVRTLESYVAQKRLPMRYVKGKTRPVADFEAADLDTLKLQLPATVGRVTESETPQNRANPENPETTQNSQNPNLKKVSRNSVTTQNSANSTLALAGISDDSNPVFVIEAAHLQELLRAALGANLENSATPQNLAAKFLLTLGEAQNLTGLSRETLRKAIAEGELPARQMGRAWRVRPEDVRLWLEKQFQNS